MRVPVLLAGSAVLFFGTLFAFQKPFREYPGTEYNVGNIPLPADYDQKTDFVFARLMFPGGGPGVDGYYPRYQGDYHFGRSLWTQDYPRADRHFLAAVRRLTRVDARSVEQVVDLEDGDDAFNFPFLYAVQAGEWGLTEKQGKLLREFVDRGGFFIGDDFHGPYEYEEFAKRVAYAFPDRPLREIPDADQVFHTVYDLNDRHIIVGRDHLYEGSKNGGTKPGWVAIYDDKGRVVTEGWFNQDTGDAWEWADDSCIPGRVRRAGDQ